MITLDYIVIDREEFGMAKEYAGSSLLDEPDPMTLEEGGGSILYNKNGRFLKRPEKTTIILISYLWQPIIEEMLHCEFKESPDQSKQMLANAYG